MNIPPASEGSSARATLVADPLDHRWREGAPREWLAQWTPRPVAVEGGAIEVVEMGDGPPLVMLPPLPGWKEAFVACAPLIARRFRVITFDMRTRFAARSAPGLARLADWDQLVADAHAIAAALAPGPVAVLGHSLGAALALRWALAHSGQVRALVLSSGFARVFTPRDGRVSRWVEQPIALAGMRWTPEEWSRRWTRSVAARHGWVFDPRCNEAVIEFMRFGVRATSFALARDRVALAFAHDVRDALGALRCPTLILTGERDSPFALAAAEELSNRVPHAERSAVPGSGHLHPLSNPDEFAARVTEWLAGVESRATRRDIR